MPNQRWFLSRGRSVSLTIKARGRTKHLGINFELIAKLSNPENSTPFSFLRRHWYQKIPNFWVHLLVYMKILSGDAHLPKHPRKCLKSVFSMSSSKETGPSLLSFQMIFEILQSELFRFKIHSVRSKILKIPEFNLKMFEIPNDATDEGQP